MRRACRVTLKFVTANKHRHIAALLQAYRAAVNFYIRSLWQTPGKLDKDTLARLQRTRLSERFKSQALKQALETVVATKRSANALKKRVTCPVFRGSAVLDAKFVTIENGRGSFDLVIRLSCLRKGVRLTLPTRKTSVLNKWLSMPNARLVQGCAINEHRCIVWVELPDAATIPPTYRDDVIAVDLGVKKLLTASDGAAYGTDFTRIRDKIVRRQPGSRGRRRAYAERDNFINRTINQLFQRPFRVIGVEALHDMKRGKSRKRGKSFRKALAPWTYRHVLTRLEHKAQENRVLLIAVPPAFTSQTCPVCSMVSRDNRHGERFQCVRCGYAADADYVGAQNILARTWRLIGSVESPMAQQEKACHKRLCFF